MLRLNCVLPQTTESGNGRVPFQGFPAALTITRALPRWVLWRWEQRDGKATKPPITIQGEYASSTNPAHWATADEALAVLEAKPGLFDGLGLVVTESPIAGLDLDHCRDPQSGRIAEWAQKILNRAHSYAEVSPSGTGLRVFGLFSGAEKVGRRFQMPESGSIEVYANTKGRFLTVTGAKLAHSPDKLEDLTLLVTQLVGELGTPAPLFDLTKTAPALTLPPLSFPSFPAPPIPIPPKLAAMIEQGAPEGQRSEVFMHAVGWMKDIGFSVEGITAELAKHPSGIAAKYEGRLEAEVKRAFDKCQTKPKQPPRTEPPKTDWYGKAQVNKSGTVESNLANVMLALREDVAFSGVLYFCEMQRATLIRRSILRHSGEKAFKGPFPRPITDDDVTAVNEWLQIAGIRHASRDTVFAAVDAIARENAVHPVKEYLNGLRWDGKKRLGTWLSNYLKAEANEYTAAVGTMFLIAAVARIEKPGCKVDSMLILEGTQGTGKSTACAVLGGEWFSDSMPDDIASKDAAAHLRGKWIIEMGELHALSRSETTSFKKFLTRQEERYRPAYGRKEVNEPRQCVFIGTTNKDMYLKDETGGRRFWPVATGVSGVIDTLGLRADRDQLFAEALTLYRSGTPWWPDRDFEARVIAPQQAERYDADAWESAIAEWIANQPDPRRFTVAEVAAGALGVFKEKLGRAEQNRITAALERIGWQRGPRGGATGAKYWVPLTR
jgi:predicted P-loop ATPase